MRIQNLETAIHPAILLDEVKDHLRIDGADEDASIGALIATATILVETHLGMALIDRPVAIYLDAWFTTGSSKKEPWWSGLAEGSINALDCNTYHAALPVKPVSSIQKVEIVTIDGSSVEWGADNYYLKPGHSPALVRKYGRAWPVPGAKAGGIQITATAGFGPDWNHVPASIRQALLILVAHLYYNRGETTSATPMSDSGVDSLLYAYRDMRL